MNTRLKLPEPRVAAGFAASLSCVSGRAAAADAEGMSADILLWLYALPNWLLAAVVAGAFAGLFLLGWAAYRRWYAPAGEGAAERRNKRARYYVAATGAVVGIVFALLIADTWEAYLSRLVTGMPPPAAGKAPVKPEDLTREWLAELLDENPAEVSRLTLPEQARAALPDDVRSLIEGAQEREGTLQVRHMDYDDQSLSHIVYLLDTDAGERWSLHFAARPRGALSGTRVKVKGTVFHGINIRDAGDTEAALLLENGDADLQILELSSTDGGTASTTGATAPLANTFGEQKSAVMLVNFQDNPGNQPWTVDQARTTVLGTVSDFMRENSYGQTWLGGDAYGWYTLPLDSTVCDSTKIADKANAAATAAGVDLTKYNRYIYIFPKLSACGWSGAGTVGGNPSQSWINGKLELKAIGHEFGHNLGLYHSHSLECGATTLGSSCTSSDYGDHFDIMGNYTAGHMSAFQKIQLGWLGYGSSPAVTVVESGGTFLLEPYELSGTSAAAKALKVLKNIDPATGVKNWYYLEFRQALGADGFLAGNNNVLNGIVFHSGTDGDSNSGYLLDLTPASKTYDYDDWEDSALAQTLSFTDPDSGAVITTEWTDSSAATVNVDFGAQTTVSACARGNPSLALTPSEQSGIAGAAAAYTLSLTNNDDPACANAATFNLQASAPSGWSAVFAAPSLTVSPGGNGATTLTLTSANTAAAASYSTGVTATDGGYSGSATASYTVITSLAVTASTDKTSYSRNQTVSVTSTVKSGATPIAGAAVMFTVTKANGSTVIQNATSDASGTAKTSVKLSRKDPTGSYGVKSQATLQTLTGSAQTTFTVVK